MEKEVPEVERRLAIKNSYLGRMGLLEARDVEDKEVYVLIRGFFADFLKLNYEFTYEELSIELNKIFIKPAVKQRVDLLLSDLSMFEYQSQKILAQPDLKELLSGFREVIESLIPESETMHKKPSLFEKLFPKKTPAKSEARPANPLPTALPDAWQPDSKADAKADDLPSLDELYNTINAGGNLVLAEETRKPRPVTPFTVQSSILVEDDNKEIVRIHQLMEQSYGHLSDNRQERAKEIYMDAILNYNRLSNEDKMVVYSQLYELYRRLSR